MAGERPIVKVGPRNGKIIGFGRDGKPVYQSAGSDKAAFTRAITPEEREALLDYTDEGHEIVNGLLRGLRLDPSVRPRAEAMVAALDSAMARSPLADGTTLYRGVGQHTAAKLRAIPVGGAIEDRGFMSTSLSRDVAAGFGDALVEIRIAPGAVHGLELTSGTSGLPHEREILLQRGLLLRKVSESRADHPERGAIPAFVVDAVAPGAMEPTRVPRPRRAVESAPRPASASTVADAVARAARCQASAADHSVLAEESYRRGDREAGMTHEAVAKAAAAVAGRRGQEAVAALRALTPVEAERAMLYHYGRARRSPDFTAAKMHRATADRIADALGLA